MVIADLKNNAKYDKNLLKPKSMHVLFIFAIFIQFPYISKTESGFLHTCFNVFMCVPVLHSVSLWRSFGARVKNNTLIRSEFHACEFSLLVDREAKADFFLRARTIYTC